MLFCAHRMCQSFSLFIPFLSNYLLFAHFELPCVNFKAYSSSGLDQTSLVMMIWFCILRLVFKDSSFYVLIFELSFIVFRYELFLVLLSFVFISSFEGFFISQFIWIFFWRLIHIFPILIHSFGVLLLFLQRQRTGAIVNLILFNFVDIGKWQFFLFFAG